MKLTMLGTGGAFSRLQSNPHNNALLEVGDKTYLLDCSLYAFDALERDYDMSPLDLDGVIITHMHGDHISGLEELGFQSYFLGSEKPDLYCHPNLLPSRQENSDGDLDLWENCLRGGMEKIQDEKGNPKKAELDTYFNVHPVGDFRLRDKGENLSCTWFPANHAPEMEAFSLKFEGNRKTYFSADNRPMWEEFYNSFDLILHECLPIPYYPATIHTHFEELEKLPESIQEKMHLMHYGDIEIMEEKTSDIPMEVAKPGMGFEL